MSKPKLFEPLRVRNLALDNRIVIAPMCQYSCDNDGRANDWHAIHLGHLALSGAALLTIEATAVLPEGRITWADLGLWDDATEAALHDVLQRVRAWSDMPIAIQLAHAGRKASCETPWARRTSTRAGRRAWLADRLGERDPALPEGATRRLHSTPTACARSAMPSPKRHGAPRAWASTPCRSTPRTATCCINSFRR